MVQTESDSNIIIDEKKEGIKAEPLKPFTLECILIMQL